MVQQRRAEKTQIRIFRMLAPLKDRAPAGARRRAQTLWLFQKIAIFATPQRKDRDGENQSLQGRDE